MNYAHTLPISAIILTYNEERNLPECLQSLHGWIDEVLIVDSGSTDRTQDIARSFGAQVVEHPFETHAKQWAWALEQLSLRHAWIIGLDADQRITHELRDELYTLFNDQPERLTNTDGIYIKRRQIFRGAWIRHGGYYPKYLLKLFRRKSVFVDPQDLMDHHFYVSGTSIKLQHDILEDNQKEQSIAFWIEKHNRYAILHAREELKRRDAQHTWPLHAALLGSPDQQVIWLKQRWDHMPLYVRPFLYFFLRYVILLGFLDGKQGFIFHFLQGFWYRLLVDIHLDELLSQEADQKISQKA
jgi:glycosyltransferase involved in cell wall biosynthesis